MQGKFIISLDFELHWGIADVCDLESKKDYFDATRESIPKVLALFEKYSIHATWATVGFLFAENKAQLLEFSPLNKPSYANAILNNYNLFAHELGNDESDDPYHYAPSLIRKIIATPNQELATHTFSHYYCNEPGQTKEQFDADLKAAQKLAQQNFGKQLQSLVFPRNQFNLDYIAVAKANGIKVVRSNPDKWFWKGDTTPMRLARSVDTLFPVGNPATHGMKMENDVLLLPATRFLRPYTSNEKPLQWLKFRRIKSEMKFAAKHNLDYHLWWHPHNFGYSTEENLAYLEEILQYYMKLNHQYNFTSVSMIERCTNK